MLFPDSLFPRRRRVPIRGRAWLVLGGVMVIRVGLAALVPVVPAEARYAQWARHGLACGAPPPAAVAGILLGTRFLGPTVGGLRLAALAVGLAGLVAAYRAAWWWTGRRTAAEMAGALAAGVPLLAALGVLAVPSAFVAACLFVALEGLARLLRHGQAVGWYLVAVAVAGAVWSTPAALPLAALIPLALAAGRGRRWWRTRHLALAAGLLVLLTAPWWLWEMGHGWRLTALALAPHPYWHGNPFKNMAEFLGEQTIALSPPFIVAVLLTLKHGLKTTGGTAPTGPDKHGGAVLAGANRGTACRACDPGPEPSVLCCPPIRFGWLLAALAAGPFLAVGVASLWVQTHPDWTVAAFPALVVFVAARGADRPAVRRWVKVTLSVSAAVALAIPAIEPGSLWLMKRLPNHSGLRQTLSRVPVATEGYREMALTFDRVYRSLPEPRPFVFGKRAEFTAPLAFHWPAGPYVHDFRRWERPDLPADLQSSLWEDHEALVGQDGLLVAWRVSRRTVERLGKVFDRLETPQVFFLERQGTWVTPYCAIVCRGFRGSQPPAAPSIPARSPYD